MNTNRFPILIAAAALLRCVIAVTAHADQVPPLGALEAEHCYLWWEILLVTGRDRAAVQDVFVFVAEESEIRIRLLDDQAETVALLGAVPAEAFELFAEQGFQPVVDYDAGFLGAGAFLVDRNATAADSDLAEFAARVSVGGAPEETAAPVPAPPVGSLSRARESARRIAQLWTPLTYQSITARSLSAMRSPLATFNAPA